MRLFGRKGSSEKLTVKRVKGYVFKDCKLIRTFGLFVTVKDHDTHQIHMADFIDNYSTSRQALDVFIEKLFRLAPYQIQDVMDDAKRERELEEMELLNISEIKRPKGGGMEIKFFDRLKALEKLQETDAGGRESEGAAFYAALEKGAAALKDCDENHEG